MSYTVEPASLTIEEESGLQVRVQAAAQRLQTTADQVRTYQLELRQMLNEGLLVDMDVHGTSMLSVSATDAETGRTKDDPRLSRYTKGSKSLFPGYSKKLLSLEQRARQNLERWSFPVPAFGGYRWLPWSAYDQFIAEHDGIVAELEATKLELLSRYDELAEENREYFAAVAEDQWSSLTGKYRGQRVVIVLPDGGQFDTALDHDKFVEYLVQRAMGKIPTAQEIEKGIRIDYKLSILASLAELEQERAGIAQAHADQAEAQTRQAQAEQEAFELQLDRRTAQRKADASVEAWRRSELDHARDQLVKMGSPLLEALDALRDNLYSAVKTLLEGVQKNGGFKGRASTKAADLYAYWQRLNGGILQDAALDAALADLDTVMQQYEATSSQAARQACIGDVVSALNEIAALTNVEARKIHQGGGRAAHLEL